MKIAILGGGNGSYAAVADMIEAGHDVKWWRRSMQSFAGIDQQNSLTIIDYQGTRQVHPARTDQIGEAIRGAELILVPTPADAHESIARQLSPHLVDGQVIYLPPGTFGSYLMMKRIREQGSKANFMIAETGTLPWLARKQNQHSVHITTRASRLPTGVLPAKYTDRALAIISLAFVDAIEKCEDALSGALMNAGPIIHPPLILMNAGPIEHFDAWDIHNEGTQPSIRNVHTALDCERIAIREALGYGAPHFPLSDHYETKNWMYGNLAHDKLVDSGDWHEQLNLREHRYMSEDTGLGLALMVSVANWAGVPCPVARGLLSIAGAASGNDFSTWPRTFEAFGLNNRSQDEVQTLLREGF
jgi:opine dehydrogenase